MQINEKSLEKLTYLINEETTYRKGSELVAFFNDLGFHDHYGPGFPSRFTYTKERLDNINGSPEMDKCIRKVFQPYEFIGRYSDLDKFIADFNQYLLFDGWQVIRNNTEISFKRGKADVDKSISKETASNEQEFLSKEYHIEIDRLPIENFLKDIINQRLSEIEKCMNSGAALAAIVLSGSTLEGLFMSASTKYPKLYNKAKAAPKMEGKVKPYHLWTLKDYIDVSAEIGLILKDVKEFSHTLQGFRNYIHPYEQMSQGFTPNIHTAAICFQVLKAAICQTETNYHILDAQQ